jgi:hypothetical protein
VRKRPRLIRLRPYVVVAFVLAATGCGTERSVDPPRRAALSPWPSAGDYQTIKIAAAVRDHALFHESDWRRKSYAAQLALTTLMTVRLAAGPCATFVTGVYGNLRDLLDAYPGEDWRPLYAVVRQEPPLSLVCQRPTHLAIEGPSL